MSTHLIDRGPDLRAPSALGEAPPRPVKIPEPEPQVDDSVERSVDAIAQRTVSDLHRPNALIFWSDMLLTAAITWSAFGVTLVARPFSPSMAIAMVVATLALYRGVSFIHELSHLRRDELPGFSAAWNVLFGSPALLPSVMYVGVHANHHRLSTYGTLRDPEYQPFAGDPARVIGFLASVFFLPTLLLVRFFVIGPLALVSRGVNRWATVHVSTLAMNFRFEREAKEETERAVWHAQARVLVFWAALAVVLTAAGVSGRAFVVWSFMMIGAAVLNALRALTAHRYESDGGAASRSEQLVDSVTTAGNLLTELWAPVGLRYHSVHHSFPGIPYHNLRKAHRRLLAALPRNAPVHVTTRRGLVDGLRQILRGHDSEVSP